MPYKDVEERRLKQREYRSQNLIRVRKYHLEYYYLHKDKLNGRRKERTEGSGYSKEYYLKNREEILKKQKEYTSKHRLHKYDYDRKRYLEKKDELLAKKRKYYQSHKELYYKIAKRWRDNNREKLYNILRNRRARKRGSNGVHNPEEWKTLLSSYGHRCAYCGKDDKRLERDHLIPIVCGGSDFIENIIPSCHSCNASKGTKTAEEFMNYKGVLHDISTQH